MTTPPPPQVMICVENKLVHAASLEFQLMSTTPVVPDAKQTTSKSEVVKVPKFSSNVCTTYIHACVLYVVCVRVWVLYGPNRQSQQTQVLPILLNTALPIKTTHHSTNPVTACTFSCNSFTHFHLQHDVIMMSF